MNKKPDHISQEDWDDLDIPELTEEELEQMRPASEVLPDIVETYRQTRGRQQEPVKQQVSIRLSPEVLDFFRSKGKGWQTQIDDILKAHISRR